MLSDRLPRHVEVSAQLAEGLAIVPMQHVEQMPAPGVRKRLEHQVQVRRHSMENMQVNACMSSGARIRNMRPPFSVALCLSALLASAARTAQDTPKDTNPPAVFTDPDRRAKLAKAFPEIDKQIAAFMERAHVPGAAWGIIVDGELAHVGAAGLRELATKTPVKRDTVFRIASMTKS